jgi:integrase
LEDGLQLAILLRHRRFVSVKGTKAHAQQKLRELLTSLDSGIPLDTSKATVGEFLERWMRDYVATNTAPSTTDGYSFIVRCHLTPALGGIPLKKLQPAHLQEYYAKALAQGRRDGKGGLSARSVQHHHRVLSEALSHAVKWGLIARNVANSVDPPKPGRTEMAILFPDDVNKLLGAAQGTSHYSLIFTGLYTGMRRGELLGLRWCDVDLLMATISVTQSLQRLYGGEFTIGEPKTARSRRLIALPPSLAILLRQHKAQQEEQRKLLGLPLSETGLVFAHLDGSPLDPSTVSHAFGKLVTRAGLPHMRFHDLRHAHASLMLRIGVNPKVISERLGHSSIAITMDIYSHCWQPAQMGQFETREIRGVEELG